ncbi:GNAT family N-acetyltransferase [Nocardioides sp. URHA0020]|uniref:GNAT family N-acetyltransferase n=1 Tax=Nocardioides sp. URHA0020 TaxID=1380392 RepID=UPI00048E106F|nr:GNAT family N-acetyltransferase [Nocardioides sp. URHA0020]
MTELRPARREDLDAITAIEREADQVFVPLFGRLDWTATPATERLAAPGFLLVADDPPVGFAHVLELERSAHLEQLAVRPSHARRGIGSALVRAAMAEAARRGYAEITLCTYADVPWNAPFYRLLGFEEVAKPGPLHRRMRDHEQAIGLDRHGRRVVMRARTDSGSI